MTLKQQHTIDSNPANKRRWNNDGITSSHRLRRCTDVMPALVSFNTVGGLIGQWWPGKNMLDRAQPSSLLSPINTPLPGMYPLPLNSIFHYFGRSSLADPNHNFLVHFPLVIICHFCSGTVKLPSLLYAFPIYISSMDRWIATGTWKPNCTEQCMSLKQNNFINQTYDMLRFRFSMRLAPCNYRLPHDSLSWLGVPVSYSTTEVMTVFQLDSVCILIVKKKLYLHFSVVGWSDLTRYFIFRI